MTKAELKQIAIVSAVAATTGALASAVVAYVLAKAIEKKYDERLQARASQVVRSLRRPAPSAALGQYPTIRRGL